MILWQKETMWMSLFVFIGTADLFLRFFWLERENWVCNPGIFWGLALSPMVLAVLTTLFLSCIAWLSWKTKGEQRFWLGLILLGGGVNTLDRFFYGCVLDYFTWPFGIAQFLPNFNLADMILVLGVSGFLLVSLKEQD